MAKLLAPYALCPLAERKRFVGISPDAESGCVIVTLARNIVIRYRLSNQKQVGSWSTKAMLSAPVIYDHSSKQYYGTFNGDEVASWEEHVVTLGKRSKNKFAWPIHSIVSSEDCPAVVVYKNGIISPLKADMSSSKNPPTANMDQILSENETIKDARLVSLSSVHYVAIFTMTDKELPVVHLIPVDQDRGTRASIRLERSGATLTASAILDGETPNLITLWSDGDMYTLEIPVKDNVPGKLLSKVMCIDPKQPAALLQLGQEHFTLYGAAPNSEGAYLVILSRQFGLPESMTKMKVYDSESRLWTCRNNIVLILGGYLVVAPFRLATVKLISLLGVDTTTSKANDEVDCVADNTSGGIAARINQLKENGSTEYAICELLFGEYLESGNETGLKCVLENVNDVPDKWLVQVVIFALGLNGELLLQVLRHPLTGDNTALTLVRQKLELTSAVKLMGIITQVLKDDEIDKCVLDWACLLLDAHYLQCLLSKDEQLVTTIRELHEAVQDHIDSTVTFRSLLAEINYFKKGKVSSKTPSVSSHSYVVEKIKLY